MIASLRRTLRRSNRARELYASLDLLRKYGRLHPTRTPIAGTPHFLHADPREKRGQALLRGHCAGQSRLKRIWSRAIDELRPTLALDVGANYGEFVFAPSYPPVCRAVAVEANPLLMPWLERSHAEHPCQGRISLHCMLASDQGDGHQEFFVDPTWSGRSSAATRRDGWRRHQVPTATIDHLCADVADGPLVFKIDIEGFEPKAIRGMRDVLARFAPIVGLAEFDARRIRESGEDVMAYLRSLADRFTIVALPSKREPVVVTDLSSPILASGQHVDLLLTSERELAESLAA